MGTIKDRMVWTLQKQKILRRGDKSTEELYKKYLHDPENHGGVITHLEPDILEWALGSIIMNIS